MRSLWTCVSRDTYHSVDVAGKPVQFKVKVTQVSGLKLPQITDEFAKSLGVDSAAALRDEVAKNMRRELDQMIQAVTKERAFNHLLEKNAIEVPKALLDDEIDRLANEAHEQLAAIDKVSNCRGISLKRVRTAA